MLCVTLNCAQSRSQKPSWKYSEFFPPLLPSKLQEDNTCITGNYRRSLICNPSDCVILLRVESYEIQVNLRITCMKCRWSIIILQLTQSKRFISFFDHTQRIQFTRMSFVA